MAIQIPVIEIFLWGNRVGAMSWNDSAGYADFEYDRQFLKSGLEVAPLMMPLERTKNTISFPNHRASNCFKGLPGLIADSLPDKFGSQLILEWFLQQGKPESLITPLDKLCYVGKRAMGAFEFKPAEKLPGLDLSSEIYVRELMRISDSLYKQRENFQELIRQKDKTVLEILRVGTSAGGAKPKAIIAFNETTGEVRSGQVAAPEGFGYWLLKFDGGIYSEHNEISDNPKGIGNIEYAYYKMAMASGIQMTECRLFEEDGSSHFMTRRFDRQATGEKIHMLTAAGIAHLDRDARHSYEEIFSIVRRLKLHYKETEELFRRMVFNVIMRNHDDHTKNFSFLMDKEGNWSLAPAYDLCYSYNPLGRWTRTHQLSLNSKTEDFNKNDLFAVADTVGVRNASGIITEIMEVAAEWESIAKDCGVRKEHIRKIGETLLRRLK